ncbi:MAG: MMPL family transporter, partial [Acetobacteraceae bacterium]
LGLTGMLFAGFPGMAQLGLFSMVGILVAAAATRWVLPRLIVAADLAALPAGDPARLLRVERLRRWRLLGLVPVAAAGLVLAVHGVRWEDDLAHLSPVPRKALALDAALRSELGAPDTGPMVVVRGGSEEDVLEREEMLLPLLDRLRGEQVIGGAELAARFLPSQATQRARRAMLPAPAVLATRLAEAGSGMPFRAGVFRPFIDAVAATRDMTPVRASDLTSPLIAARLQPLLFERDGTWFGLIAPQSVADPARLAGAFANQPEVIYIDMHAQTSAIMASDTRHAWHWLGLGGLAALAALAVGLRDPGRVVRVAAAIGSAGLVSLALLALLGARLSLIHIVALQFVAGVGLDYALFFARAQLDREERARTLRTLITCNAMTLLTFGTLALCRTPLLAQIGVTVTIGAVAAMVFAFLFAGEKPGNAWERT